MGKCVLGRLAIATVAALTTLTWVTRAAAVQNIDSCQELTQFGETYRVTESLSSCGGCFIVANDRITIDLQQGFIQEICFPGEGEGITDSGIARDATTVKNGAVRGYNTGINLGASTRTTLRNLTVEDNTGHGIVVGNQSLVKDCTASRNGFNGIQGGDRVQVENCDVMANGFDGIGVRDHCLVTRNVAIMNGSAFPGARGITVRESCTVSLNVSNANKIGILAGQKNLITGNTVNDNAGVGIFVHCPTTVTHNKSSGNGSNYFLLGSKCFANDNH